MKNDSFNKHPWNIDPQCWGHTYSKPSHLQFLRVHGTFPKTNECPPFLEGTTYIKKGSRSRILFQSHSSTIFQGTFGVYVWMTIMCLWTWKPLPSAVPPLVWVRRCLEPIVTMDFGKYILLLFKIVPKNNKTLTKCVNSSICSTILLV